MRGFLYIALLAPMLAIAAIASRSRPVRSEAPVLAAQLRSAVRYVAETRTDPPLHLHIVQVDLTYPGVTLSAATAGPVTKGAGAEGWSTTLQTVSQIAEREGFDLAVNGDFFSHDVGDLGQLSQYRAGAPARTMGPLVCDGRTVRSATQQAAVLALTVDAKGRPSIGAFATVPDGARQFVCGNYLLVRDGKVSVPDRPGTCSDRTPVTAVGLDRAGKTLTLLVADGRREDYSVGMTLSEAAAELVRLGCDVALNLDGGGSSTLVFRDARDGSYHVANRPSDGHQLSTSLSLERPVASALGIRLSARPALTAAAAAR